jgi:polyphosphate kinase 2 (PPK2 family)
MSKKSKNHKKSKSTPDGTKHSGVNGQPKIGKKEYEAEIFKLQVELVKLQDWVKTTDARIVIIFEGRDAAGKGGMIKRIMECVSPRIFRVVALPSPTERQKTQLHAQRYIERLPAGGHSGAREKLEVVLAHRLHLGRRRPNAEELRADAKAGGSVAEK